ncbi:hypothetical protein [Streptomyces gardneri]|uniref:hypothetical protein n=1 Tax=Streptomyces gardneri TaxID=66892 RepID=UPI0035D7C2D4
MSDIEVDDWSPADHPYAIAVSEAQWWKNTAVLAVSRMRSGGETVGWFDARQIDARQLCVALRQLLMAEKLQQISLDELNIDPLVSQELARAREQFEESLPGIKDIRDGLTHFEDWSRGKGRGPQRARIKAGESERDVARAFWSFGYDAAADTVSMGPYQISVDVVEQAASQLAHAIYLAAHHIDMANATQVRDTAVQALAGAKITRVRIIAGDTCAVLLSLDPADDLDEPKRLELAARVVAATENAALRLFSTTHPQHTDVAQRLADGETLQLRQI